MKLRIFLAALAASALSFGMAQATTIVVNHDEWTLSDTGFASAADTGTFVSNLVAEFGPDIHAYSNNFGFTGSSLGNAMTSAGANYSTGTGFAFTLANISAFDAIMLGGHYLSGGELAVLAAYVAGGGNVYIAGGTGVGGSAAEAAAWNSFLAPFGIQMSSSYDGIGGNRPVAGDSLFAGVGSLYSNNGNGLTGSSVVCCGASVGEYAVYRAPAPVPLPASSLLLGTALAGIALLRRKRG